MHSTKKQPFKSERSYAYEKVRHYTFHKPNKPKTMVNRQALSNGSARLNKYCRQCGLELVQTNNASNWISNAQLNQMYENDPNNYDLCEDCK